MVEPVHRPPPQLAGREEEFVREFAKLSGGTESYARAVYIHIGLFRLEDRLRALDRLAALTRADRSDSLG